MPNTIRPVGSEPPAEATPASSAIHASAVTTKRFIGRNLQRPCYGGVTILELFCDAANRYSGDMELGFALSSEDHPPNELVRQAQIAERAGFTFALISDHFHPWVSDQGHSPFVWSTLGGIAQATEKIRLGTGVTCPLIRIHPAIVAQDRKSVV